MANEWIKVGSTFTVTMDTTPLVTLTDYSGHLIYYRRPDGKTGTIVPDTVGASSLVGTVTITLNPLTNATGPDKWKNGYSGTWEFYPYCVGSGAVIYRGQEDFVVVHPEWRNPL